MILWTLTEPEMPLWEVTPLSSTQLDFCVHSQLTFDTDQLCNVVMSPDYMSVTFSLLFSLRMSWSQRHIKQSSFEEGTAPSPLLVAALLYITILEVDGCLYDDPCSSVFFCRIPLSTGPGPRAGGVYPGRTLRRQRHHQTGWMHLPRSARLSLMHPNAAHYFPQDTCICMHQDFFLLFTVTAWDWFLQLDYFIKLK